MAPNDKVTLSVIESYSFSGAHFILLSDFNAYLTKLGRFEAFKRAKDHTLWHEIEGKIVEGNSLKSGSNTMDVSLEQCKALCVSDMLCKAIQFPHCILKTSTNTQKIDESFQYSTHIKLNTDKTAVGVPLRGNPKGLFVKYYSNEYGLRVPNAYCPGRLLLQKIRTPSQCDSNGHWYELVHSERVNGQLHWRGVKGHLAVLTSAMEHMCVQRLICEKEFETSNIAWIGAEKYGNTNEYRWMVNGTDEFEQTFIDSSSQSLKLGIKNGKHKNNGFYAVTVCNNGKTEKNNEWNIADQNSKHYFVIEYELPLLCEESETVFEVLGPKMEYYNAEISAHSQSTQTSRNA